MSSPASRPVDLPTLRTPRLLLRPFVAADAARVSHLAGDERVSAGVVSIPFPYPVEAAEQWIAKQATLWADEAFATFAVCTNDDAGGELLGCMSLMSKLKDNRGDLGYWFGVDYWNRGYCTEAGRAVLAFAFDVLRFDRVGAQHYGNNPASGRVMRKLGMTHEGTLRSFHLVRGVRQDNVNYGLLAAEYAAGCRVPRVSTLTLAGRKTRVRVLTLATRLDEAAVQVHWEREECDQRVRDGRKGF